jgi:branched-chain amino acid transport system permease protein
MLEQLVNGLTQGGVYALLALGFVVIFGTLRILTFAHGETYMMGAYVGFEVIRHLYPSLLLALVVAIAATALLGALVEIVAFRFLRDAPHATSLLVTIGVSIILVNLAQAVWGPEVQALPEPLIEQLDYGTIEVGGVVVSGLQIAVLAVTVALMLLLYLFVTRTSLGRVVRATAQDYEAAYAMGVNVNSIFMFAFALGSLLGGVAGILVGVYYNLFHPTMGTLFGLKGFSAAVVGGLTSMPGAVIAGLMIGVVETFSVQFGSGNYRHMVSFVFMILILIFRPGGLLRGVEALRTRGD